MITFTQANRQFAVSSPLGQDVLLLKRMSGKEELGRLFQYELELLSEEMSLDANKLLGDHLTVRVDLKGGERRYFDGLVSQFTQVDVCGGWARYRAVVVPWLWRLTLNRDCRIYQHKSVPEVLKEIFDDHGCCDIENRLSGHYRQWDYCVQYQESDFSFVSRLMEHEGIYYFFEHQQDRHVLVLADSIASHHVYPGYAQIPYCPPVGSDARQEEGISEWSIHHQVRPGSFAHNDFDFRHPKKSLLARRKLSQDHTLEEAEVYNYPGCYTESADGEDYAAKRSQELHVDGEISYGVANARGMTCGATFHLTEALCQDHQQEYLITGVSYEIESDEFGSNQRAGEEESGIGWDRDGRQLLSDTESADSEQPYSCRFTAIDVSKPFRPARITAKPVIQGPQTAIVVGNESDEIWTDEHGRVKVRFHWDRYGEDDENSSCWIRVAQMWAGKKWGAQFIPRIGQEVIIEFLNGDPDRPIISGTVYNGDCMPPYQLPNHKNLSGLKSNSTKGGGGFNELRFDDTKDQEQVFIHAQKNLDTRVKNNRYETVEANRHAVVEANNLRHVKGHAHDLTGGNCRIKVGGDQEITVEGLELKHVKSSITQSTDDTLQTWVGKDHAEHANGGRFIAAANMVIEAMAGITLKVGSSSIVIDPMGVTISGPMVVVDGKVTRINSGPGAAPASAGCKATPCAPAVPAQADQADQADPGEVAKVKSEQTQKGQGKYGPAQVTPFVGPSSEDSEDETHHWIEIELKDDDGNAVPCEPYEVTLPDGESVASGRLDMDGYARIEGIDPGNCHITFPQRDSRTWKRS